MRTKKIFKITQNYVKGLGGGSHHVTFEVFSVSTIQITKMLW